ncbi:hypothetical protein Echvi_4448 [Echinicola vietnamensis DSM 17526]|uniref:Uncharacterized protein n=1 Tax=Echinicola vietnamensis (strain DSM 17526 / LMG 23754 / KMM 6221) TaxID=926556 RepID=L0G704_ECHVK|nr:hypothetical protein Echvi_4448 [Echinicola vietnamensis DSM 17526]
MFLRLFKAIPVKLCMVHFGSHNATSLLLRLLKPEEQAMVCYYDNRSFDILPGISKYDILFERKPKNPI